MRQNGTLKGLRELLVFNNERVKSDDITSNTNFVRDPWRYELKIGQSGGIIRVYLDDQLYWENRFEIQCAVMDPDTFHKLKTFERKLNHYSTMPQFRTRGSSGSYTHQIKLKGKLGKYTASQKFLVNGNDNVIYSVESAGGLVVKNA